MHGMGWEVIVGGETDKVVWGQSMRRSHIPHLEVCIGA